MVNYEDVLPWIPLFGSLIIAGALYLTFSLNRKAYNDHRRVLQVQILNELDKEITQQECKENNLNSLQECFDYARDYVNIFERIAKMHLDGFLSKGVADYFHYSFTYAKALQEWYDEIIKDPHRSDIWDNLENYVKKYNLGSKEADLTHFLREVQKFT